MLLRRPASIRFRTALRIAAAWPLAIVALAGAEPRTPEAGAVSEADLKAAFLPKIALFFQWPGDVFRSPEEPLVIGVLGNSGLAAQLERAAAGRVVAGRKLSVEACRDLAAAKRCHIVFVAGEDPKIVREHLRELAGRGVLTVGDTPGLAGEGGMVNLVAVDRRIQLEVNLDAIQRAELRVDPQFLKLARLVGPPPLKARN
jgi:hypothetical protein